MNRCQSGNSLLLPLTDLLAATGTSEGVYGYLLIYIYEYLRIYEYLVE